VADDEEEADRLFAHVTPGIIPASAAPGLPTVHVPTVGFAFYTPCGDGFTPEAGWFSPTYIRHFRDHNVVYKFFRRWMCQRDLNYVQLRNDWMWIPELAHADKGCEFRWWLPRPGAARYSNRFKWDWKEMFGEISEEHKVEIFRLGSTSPRRIVAMFFVRFEHTDTKVHATNKKRSKATYKHEDASFFGFVACFSDGSHLIFRTNYGTRKIEAWWDAASIATALAANRDEAKVADLRKADNIYKFQSQPGKNPCYDGVDNFGVIHKS